MKKRQIVRRPRIVDSEVQGGVLQKVATHWILFFLCNTVALLIWVRLYEQPDASWSSTLGETFQRYLPFFIITLALIPAFVWDTLKMTNRFAGPILRLRRALAEASAGRAVPPLHFRRNDFWKEIAEDFNQLMERTPPSVAANAVADEAVDRCGSSVNVRTKVHP